MVNLGIINSKGRYIRGRNNILKTYVSIILSPTLKKNLG